MITQIWTTYGAAFTHGVLFVGGFFVLTLWLASIGPVPDGARIG